MFNKLNNIGDSAVVCDFGDEVNQKVNNRVIKLFHHLKKYYLQSQTYQHVLLMLITEIDDYHHISWHFKLTYLLRIISDKNTTSVI